MLGFGRRHSDDSSKHFPPGSFTDRQGSRTNREVKYEILDMVRDVHRMDTSDNKEHGKPTRCHSQLPYCPTPDTALLLENSFRLKAALPYAGIQQSNDKRINLLVTLEYTEALDQDTQCRSLLRMKMNLQKRFWGKGSVKILRHGQAALVSVALWDSPGDSAGRQSNAVQGGVSDLFCALQNTYSVEKLPTSSQRLLGPRYETGNVTEALKDTHRHVCFAEDSDTRKEDRPLSPGFSSSAYESTSIDNHKFCNEELLVTVKSKEHLFNSKMDTKPTTAPGDVKTEQYLNHTKYMFMLFFYHKEVERILESTGCRLGVRRLEGRPLDLLGLATENNISISVSGAKAQSRSEAVGRLMHLYNAIWVVRGLGLPSETEACRAQGALVISHEDEVVIVGSCSAVDFLTARWLSCETAFCVDEETGDFLCGKKSGKTNRIAKATGCRIYIYKLPGAIRFSASGGRQSLLVCLGLLQGEFPASETFYVDERHHRRIIGLRGRTIQAIMKKYNVYIQFFSGATTAGNRCSGNVLMRAPYKNYENLARIKQEILWLAGHPMASPAEKDISAIRNLAHNTCKEQTEIQMANVPEDSPCINLPTLLHSSQCDTSSSDDFPCLFNLFSVARIKNISIEEE